MSTNVVSVKDIKRQWHLIDAKDQILGRLAVEVAKKLSGKDKPNFIPYLDLGDFVVVTNAGQVKVTGKKAMQKKYYRHSGYPGGLKIETFDEMFKVRPQDLIRHAVWGMLPNNKLRSKMVTRLKIFSTGEHPYSKQVR